ncbi:MAG: hypothetical protein CL923_04830 [Deltaproteobacteria bacterium]|nr:hypothetical protein [Deltaproteobacteria bacterium]MBQ31866.1 hypothetical protein [Deltaproteobacteria bacterium]
MRKNLRTCAFSRLWQLCITTATGHFGAEMQVHLVNDDPVTHWLEW